VSGQFGSPNSLAANAQFAATRWKKDATNALGGTDSGAASAQAIQKI